MRVLMYCATHDSRLVTKAEIAARCSISENHLAQVINQLGQLGVLRTRRGRSGGVELAGPASEIVVGDVFRKVEGGVPRAKCFADSDQSCPLSQACRLRRALADAAEAFYAHLDKISLDMLVGNNHALDAILRPAVCAQEA